MIKDETFQFVEGIGQGVSDRMPGNCLSHLGRVETAAMLSLKSARPIGFAESLFYTRDQRPFLRGIDGEF
ncbi:MAG: hypothetical protein K9K88_12150 [Desulfobacterales bacterium]|nr:hypothetical protein [Desulfobacterales bacterium]